MDLNSRSLVTVVVPSFNRENLIGKTLDSVIAQTYTNWECFVVDDLSTDKTCEVVKFYEKKDKRISLIQMKKKGNANISRNRGIELAKGDYVAMLDSDDLWLKNHLESRLSVITTNNSYGVYGGTIFKTPHSSISKTSRIQKSNESNFYFVTFSMVPKQTSSLFFRTDTIKKIMWDEDLGRHQDFDLLYRFLNKYSLRLDNNITVVLNLDPTRNSSINASGKVHNLYLDGCIQYFEKYRTEFYNYPVETGLYLYTFVKLVIKKKKWFYIKYYSLELLKLMINLKRLKPIIRYLIKN